MDHLRVLPIIVAAFGLWLALHAGGLLLGWLRLMRLRHLHGVAEAAGRAAMAPEVAAILDPVAPRLAALGFAHEESLRVAPQVRGADEPHWVDVYVHAATGARALVDINAAPEPGFAAGVAFVSVCAGSGAARATLETLNRRRHTRLPTPAGHELADAGASTLAQHWAFHLQRLGSQVDHVVLDGDRIATVGEGPYPGPAGDGQTGTATPQPSADAAPAAPAEPVTERTMRGRSRCSSCRSVRRLAGLDGQWLVFLHG